MHVGVPDQHREDEPADMFVSGILAGFPSENGSDVGIAAASILVTGKEPEHLCETFHVNRIAAGNAVEPLISPEAKRQSASVFKLDGFIAAPPQCSLVDF